MYRRTNKINVKLFIPNNWSPYVKQHPPLHIARCDPPAPPTSPHGYPTE